MFPILESTQNNISCSGQIKFVVVQHDIRHYGSITDIKRTKKEQNPIFCAMCPTKDFQNKVQKSYVLFGFFVSVTLGLKNRKNPPAMCKITGLCNHSLYWTYLPNYFHFLANFEHSLLCKIPKWQL